MQNSHYSHIAFADESNWNKGQFRSIALVTAEAENARNFHMDIRDILKSRNRTEFKWQKVNSSDGVVLAKYYFEHLPFIRVDVLIWDIYDSRRKNLPGRDDKSDFARMYYHLLYNVLKSRWPNSARWLICADKQKEVDWLTLENCLDWKKWIEEEALQFKFSGALSLGEFYNIYEIRQVSSEQYALVQLADLFAGLGAYSHTTFNKYINWEIEHGEQVNLKLTNNSTTPQDMPSKNDLDRFKIIEYVYTESKRNRFQLSFRKSKGFKTNNPENPLNFWFYTPQHPNDRAPVKGY